MSRKSSKKTAKPPVANTAPAGNAYPVEPMELDAQNARLKQAAAAGVQALKTIGPEKVKVGFVLLEPAAKSVSLRGEFNGWLADATPLQRSADGRWEATLALAPGRYEYKFFVDGQWIPDPQAQDQVWNHHGSLNSVVLVRG